MSTKESAERPKISRQLAERFKIITIIIIIIDKIDKMIHIAECANKVKKQFVILQANAQSLRKKNTNGGIITLQDHSTGTYANKLIQNAIANGTSIN